MLDAAAIKDAILKLESADRKLTVFGASTHKWRLRPPASAAEVNKFEKRFSVVLPDDYRDFLCSVGNGGAGPHYGLFPLGVFSEQSERADNLIGELSRPFPHSDAWNQSYDGPDPDVDEAAYTAWRTRYFDRKWIDGAIPICHEGCGYYELLVVTGPERGHVWIDGRVSDQGIAPRDNAVDKRQTFLDWYTAWLDECLRKRKLR